MVSGRQSRDIVVDGFERPVHIYEGELILLSGFRAELENLHRSRPRGLGGKAEQGESPIECVKREIREEAGIEIQPIWKGVVTFSDPSTNDWEAHVFVAEGFKGELISCNEGELTWIDESEVLNLDMPEGDKKIMPLLFEKNKFHAHLKYDADKRLVDSKIDFI